MKIRLVCVGKNRTPETQSLIDFYSKKIPFYMPFELTVIPDIKTSKATTALRQKEEEGRLILQQLSPGDSLWLFDERGREFTSREFADFFERKAHEVSKSLVLVIGGPYGFSPDVYDRSDGKLSLSRMTLPHELARLFAVEQMYRAMTILRGEPYHHD